MSRTVNLYRSQNCRVSLVYYEPDETIAAHKHAGAQFTFVLAGDYVENSAAGRLAVPGPAVGTKPAGYEHANIFGAAGALILSVRLPAEFQVESYDVIHAPKTLPLPGGMMNADRATGLIELANTRMQKGARILPDQTLPCWVADARDALSVRRQVGMLARQVGLHPGGFARSFRRATGMNPTAFRSSRRLAQAIRATVLEQMPLIAIAHEAGFADQAHFARSMRAATGFTPRQLRALLTISG